MHGCRHMLYIMNVPSPPDARLQALSKKLVGGSGTITCLAVHPSGDHVLVGSDDKRLAWWVAELHVEDCEGLKPEHVADQSCRASQNKGME